MHDRKRGFAVAGPLAALASCCFAQGPLAPPGPPGPTMKSLEEIHEAALDAKNPGIAVNAENTPGDQFATFVISASGRYYLPASLQGEVGKAVLRIDAADVTIDMNGMAINGVAGTLAGIEAGSAFPNVRVSNGTVRGCGDHGVSLGGRARVSNLFVESCQPNALSLGSDARVVDCVVSQSGGIAVTAGSIVSRCTLRSGTGTGISISSGDVQVRECTIIGYEFGIFQSSGGTSYIAGNVISTISDTGIDVCAENMIVDNLIEDCTVAAIDVRCGGNVVTRNVLLDNGIAVDATQNNREQVYANTLRDNTTNFTNTTGNYFAPVGTAATATNPFTNLNAP